MNEREVNLKAIEDCGAAEMPISETCIIAEMSEADFAADAEAQARYRRGQLQTKLAVRQSVVKMAKEGVPQMVKIYLDFNREGAATPIEIENLAAELHADGAGAEDTGEFDAI